MELSDEIIEDVLLEYKRTRSPFRTANLTGLDASVVWSIIEEHSNKLTAYPERHGGYGRFEVEKYIVARRTVTSRSWDNTDPAIADARLSYEAGTHELATGRDGGWLILYAIPRKKVTPRPNYFRPETF